MNYNFNSQESTILHKHVQGSRSDSHSTLLSHQQSLYTRKLPVTSSAPVSSDVGGSVTTVVHGEFFAEGWIALDVFILLHLLKYEYYLFIDSADDVSYGEHAFKMYGIYLPNKKSDADGSRATNSDSKTYDYNDMQGVMVNIEWGYPWWECLDNV